jgi:hypothetical protein
MAKRKIRLKDPRNRKRTSARYNAMANTASGYYGQGRSITERVSIRRMWGHGRHKKYAFQACLVINTKAKLGGRRAPGATIQCGEGKNPRVALAAAHRKMAKAITSRSGAFAGLK